MHLNIRSGDTLWYYSNLFMIPLELILDSNPNINPDLLSVGQEVQIPGFTVQTYKIQKGDTLWKIASARNLSLDGLLLLNQGINPNQLKQGDNIKIPKRVIFPIVNGKIKYDYLSLTNQIKNLKNIYPFIQVNSIGESVLGKSIYEIKLGNGSKKVHINASFHANEWITSSILMSLLNSYLLSLTNFMPIRGLNTLHLYKKVDLSIVPMVNPDGVDLVHHGPPENLKDKIIKINRGNPDFTGWKANIRGVDLNKQFPAKWEVDKARSEEKAPAPRDFPGDSPLTEPEAITMANLAKNRAFHRMLAFHTQGKEFYWGYEGFEPEESKVLATEFERVSGYKAVQYVDSFAGYKDWFIHEFKKPGFTVELGKGINPLPLSQFDEIYEEVLGIFLASIYR